MQYPGYLLNPGDMFQVDPERVLYATGARKISKRSTDTMQGRSASGEVETVVDDDAEDLLEGEEASAEQEADDPSNRPAVEETVDDDPKKALTNLMTRAKSIMADPKDRLSGRRKQDLRAFSQTMKRTLSRFRGQEYQRKSDFLPLEDTIEALEETLSTIISKLPAESSSPATTTTTTTSSADANAQSSEIATSKPKSSNPQMADGREDTWNSRRDAQLLHAAIQRAQENPLDVSKPYATPWQPREWMSAFAFIPRYLEVNQKICSAVYLRHPVARPGLAEVPTPFGAETMGLAFNWYLRRR